MSARPASHMVWFRNLQVSEKERFSIIIQSQNRLFPGVAQSTPIQVQVWSTYYCVRCGGAVNVQKNVG